MDNNLKRYAFIDVQNTETTALKVLNFIVDWQKLIIYLEERWDCKKIFFYPGIQEQDETRKEVFSTLQGIKSEVVIRTKEYKVYKNQDKLTKTPCPNCKTEVIHKFDMGYSWKCNCDVEMTLDAFTHSGENIEIMLFTGDGDFSFLIEDIIKKGTKVSIVSSALPSPRGNSIRLSKKLKKLTSESGSPVRLLELKNLQKKIEREI